MASKSKRIAIVIPMFNEEKIAEKAIDRVIEIIRKIKAKVKLIVVNDGSRDDTLQILNNKRRIYPGKLTIVSYPKNKGYGKALQQGISKANKLKFDYVLFMDSDLTNNPKDILLFMEKMNDDPDCIKGSRYINGGGMKGVSLKRRVLSRVGNLIASLCFRLGIKDHTNGFRMLKLSKIKGIKFRENSFAIILEELYHLKKRRAKIVEIPVMLTSRKNTKTHFKYNITTFYNYGKYAIKALFV